MAQILSSAQHPNADRLRVCQVNDGTGTRQIVCGAKNYKDGDKVPLALPGAKLPGGFTIKESKLRGELSQGMLCSAKELALAEDAEGLLILPAGCARRAKFLASTMPGDTMFEVEITSNRPDLLSYRGMAREIAATGAGTLKALDEPPMSLSRRPLRRGRSTLPRSGSRPLLHRDASRRRSRSGPARLGCRRRSPAPAIARSTTWSTSRTSCSSRRASRCTPSMRRSSRARSIAGAPRARG